MKIDQCIRKLQRFKKIGNVSPERGCEFMMSLTHNKKYQITAILMQDNFSKWSIYIPFIAYNENLLILRENNLFLCLKLAISYFIT